MNNTLQKYLIEKIQEKNETKIKALRSSLPSRPDLESHILHEIMNGSVEIQNTETIKKLLTDRVLAFKDGDRLFGDAGSNWHFKQTICFKSEEFFIASDSYKEKIEEYRQKSIEINKKISALAQQEEMLVLRIQLASPKKLEKLISEVDDFSDLNLLDTKLRQLPE